MNYQEAVNFSEKYKGVNFLNKVLPQKVRSFVVTLSGGIFWSTLLLFGFLKVASNVFYLKTCNSSLCSALNEILLFFAPHTIGIVAVLDISFLVFILFYALHVYSRYYELRSIKRVFEDNTKRFKVSYEAGLVLAIAKTNGLISGLLSIPASQFILARLSVTESNILDHAKDTVVSSDVVLPEYNETITLGSLWKALYEQSDGLKKALLANTIQQDVFNDTCDWADSLIEEDKKQNAWWWRENLSKTRGIGKSLSYGSTGYMSNFATELIFDPRMKELSDIVLHKEALLQLEESLSKAHGANAVIVGARATGRHAIVMELARMVERGDCYSEIEHKRIFEFNNDTLGSLPKDDLVTVLRQCFDEALIARNIIFVFDNFQDLYATAERVGVNLFEILERYIDHPHVSLVIICDQTFYQHDTHKAIFDRSFEAIHIGDSTSKALIPYIEENALIVERETGTFFSSQAIHTIAGVLNKYFVEDSLLVKARDLMYKIATSGTTKVHHIIDEESVSSVIKSLTGVATGAITSDEKAELLDLEATLHKNIIDQNEAIKVVASTMRRSRAGLTGANKPIGSFLFFGPTGVGKTETAKTLASVFFGGADRMSRLDMGEYTMPDSSSRLLGDLHQEGDLARLVHTRPYGVLLLDEFEKATTEVKDIFLRILDEGVFTNGEGKVISLRTQIIIATSNAGSQYIHESGLGPHTTEEELQTIKATLIDTVISNGIFRPELINRFDASVVFHPLSDDSRVLVAKKMLEALKTRMLSEGYDVSFTDALVQAVTGGDTDAMFGGRAIQRNIQAQVEEALAKKIIEGSLSKGGSIILDSSDLT
jgi:ATP-dependent Clp protease ATP-binding subunit ClpC